MEEATMLHKQCRATNPLGIRCPITAAPGSKFCRLHSQEGAPSSGGREPKPETSVTGRVPESAEGLEWFQAMLQQAMTEVMAGEATPLQKASAIARLGNLYLKAYQSAELKRANAEMRRQMEELEQRLAAAEAQLAAEQAERTVDATSPPAQASSAPLRTVPGSSRSAVHLEPGSKASELKEHGKLSPSGAASAAGPLARADSSG